MDKYIYSKVGTSSQTIADMQLNIHDLVLMNGIKPIGEWISTKDGEWIKVKLKDSIEAKDHIKGIKKSYSDKMKLGFMTEYGYIIQCEDKDINSLIIEFTLIKLQIEIGDRGKTIIRDINNVNHNITFDEFTSIMVNIQDYVKLHRELMWKEIDLYNASL